MDDLGADHEVERPEGIPAVRPSVLRAFCQQHWQPLEQLFHYLLAHAVIHMLVAVIMIQTHDPECDRVKIDWHTYIVHELAEVLHERDGVCAKGRSRAIMQR